jgi:hypothetical protein
LSSAAFFLLFFINLAAFFAQKEIQAKLPGFGAFVAMNVGGHNGRRQGGLGAICIDCKRQANMAALCVLGANEL